MIWFWFLLYIACSSGGLVFIKMGINRGFTIQISQGFLASRINSLVFLGFLLYITSFLISFFILTKVQLNYFYPLSAGLIYVLVFFLSIVFLQETITVNQIIGSILILAGVIFLNLKK